MMNFVGEERKVNYFDKEEEVEEEEEDEKPFISFSSTSSSSAANSPNYSQNLSLFGAFDQSQQPHKNQDARPVDFDSNKNLDLMELSLGGTSSGRSSGAAAAGGGGGGGGGSIEKEHMFDKVVTPSDVGKLNRLVIPKQHAEKYFPLNSSTEKGLLLNFEDRNGKAWRFRYSYWNSSQSYVMTKGWSRFVKEKKLDAGDVVSFQRGVGELAKDRLFIDWRRRPNPLESTPIQFQFPFPQEVQWGRIYSMPPPPRLGSISQQFENFPNSMNGNLYPNHYNFQQRQQRQQQQHEPIVGYGNRVLQQYYSRSSLSSSSLVQEGGNLQPMVINSVPVVHGTKAVAPLKRLRLFGVNMECGSSTAQDEVISPHLASAGSSSSSFSQLRVPGNSPMQQNEFSIKKGKSSSTFDFDL